MTNRSRNRFNQLQRLAAIAAFAAAAGCSSGSSKSDAGTPTDGARDRTPTDGARDRTSTDGARDRTSPSDTGVDARRTATTMSLLNGDGLSVLSWRIDANGNVAPSTVISGSNTGLSYQTRGLAVDAQGNLYVISNISISVFAANANGNVAPLRVIQGSNVLGPTTNGYGLSPAIAVDGQGQIFAGGVGVIEVFAAGANGNAAPVRLMTGSNVSEPSAMAFDGPDLYVSDPGLRAVDVFPAGANGSVTPKRTLTVTGPTAISFTNVQLAFDGSGNLYMPVASPSVPSAANTWVAVYAPSATSPSPVLTGPATELTAATGVALDPQGNIFVANADPGAAAIVVFAAGASGGATPIRNVSGPSTGINVGGGVLELVVY